MAEPPTKRRSRVSRRIGNDDPVTESAARRHAQLAGELLWAWNELHGALCHLFTGLVDPDNVYMGMSLWNAIANESAQRDLLKAAAHAARDVRSADRQRIEWILKQTEKLAIYRNDVIHGLPGFIITERGLDTRLAYFGNSFGRLYRHSEIDTPLAILMSTMRGDLMALSGYAMAVARTAGDPARKVLPFAFERARRPRLRTLALVEANKRRVKKEIEDSDPRRRTPVRKKKTAKASDRTAG